MRIQIENTKKQVPEQSEAPTPKRNIVNIFNIPLIERELKEYGVEIKASSKRKWSDDIWYVSLVSPYIGKVKNILAPPKATTVALFVNYSTNTAFAMPRGGADKQTMMLIASTANKHINEPFTCDPSLRYTLQSKGGDTD